LTELHVEGGNATRLGGTGFGRRLRWYTLALLVTILCAAAYLLGIWTGTKAEITCSTTAPGRIVCTSDGVAPAPMRPPTPPGREQGSA
jgi:hypothetical protein